MIKPSIVTRRDFLTRFMREAGLTYDQACRTYATMTALVADAVVNGSKVGIGQVGSITPQRRPAREVTMGFKKMKGGVMEKAKRKFHLDERIVWRFKLFRAFETKHRLRNGN